MNRIKLSEIERELDYQENLHSLESRRFNDGLYEGLFEFYLGVSNKLKGHYALLLNIVCESAGRLRRQNA